MNLYKHIGIVVSSIIITAPVLGGPPKEEHFDIWLRASAGQIVTGSIGEDGVPIQEVWRVFGAELGKDSKFPFSAIEPGFQTDSIGFGSLTMLTFSVLNGLGAWNGDGFNLANETMTIEYGPASSTTGAGPIAGFDFATNSSGHLHDHFDFTLNGVLGVDPAPGIYLLSLTLAGVSPAFLESDPFYIVFNLGMSERDHEAAIDWVHTNLVPAPGALALLALVALKNRRRRISSSQ